MISIKATDEIVSVGPSGAGLQRLEQYCKVALQISQGGCYQLVAEESRTKFNEDPLAGMGDRHQAGEAATLPGIVLVPGEAKLRNLQKRISTSSADLETAITKSGWGMYNYALLLLAIPASFSIGFVTGSMSFVIPAATDDLQLNPTDKALLQSAGYAGMISSGFLWGFLSDAFGRKKLLILGYFCDCLMTILTGAFPFLPTMLIFKYLSGFMICGPFSIFSTYISEVFLRKKRDIAVLSTGMLSALGQIVLAGLGLWIIPLQLPDVIPLKSWQLFQIACCLPSFISALGFLFTVESPKFLADKGDQEGALKVCQKIYTVNTGNVSDSYPVKKLKHQSRNSENKSNCEKFLEGVSIFKPPFIQKASIIFVIHIAMVASQNSLRLWLPEMLTLVKISEMDTDAGFCHLLIEGNLARSNSSFVSLYSTGREKVYTDMMFANAGCVIGHALFLFVIKYVGKKNMILYCALFTGTCSFALPMIDTDYIFIAAAVYLSFTNIAIFCDINIVVEVFPTRIRATSVSILMLVARIGVLLVNFLIANLVYSYCQYFFYVLAALSSIAALLSFFIPQKPIDDVPITTLGLV